MFWAVRTDFDSVRIQHKAHLQAIVGTVVGLARSETEAANDPQVPQTNENPHVHWRPDFCRRCMLDAKPHAE